MRSVERVRGLIAGKAVDHLPVQPVIMMFAAKHAGIPYIEYTKDGRKMAESQAKLVRDFEIDCLLMCSDPAREVIDIAGDESVLWYQDQGPAINEEHAALQDKTRLKTFKIPDPLGGGRMHDRIKAIEILRKEFAGEVPIVGWVEGPLALAQELRGLNRIMTDFIDDAAFVKDLLDFSAEVAVVYAAAQIEAGADTIGMSDAAASMIGPTYYKDFLYPRQCRVAESIRESHPDVIVRLHMCGKTDALISQMRELPIHIFELDFPTNLAAARSRLGPDRVILGNVSTITDLLEGTPEKVYKAAEGCHAICGKYHIVGSGCEVSPMTPPENLRAMVRYGKEHKPEEFLCPTEPSHRDFVGTA
ncbi:MAG: uroporphyrinogen decarboxylase family protein [Acidobacteria bacterium]|nr:uroporphyrinogen decarboxylase family protein [Acidobacteriota bacterium]